MILNLNRLGVEYLFWLVFLLTRFKILTTNCLKEFDTYMDKNSFLLQILLRVSMIGLPINGFKSETPFVSIHSQVSKSFELFNIKFDIYFFRLLCFFCVCVGFKGIQVQERLGDASYQGGLQAMQFVASKILLNLHAYIKEQKNKFFYI